MQRAMQRTQLRELTRPASAFAANGALYGSLLARYPEIADQVHTSAGAFGLALFASALGGLAGSLVARFVVRGLGDARSTVLSGCGYAVLAVGIAAAPTLSLLAVALLLTGLFDGAHDVTMNAYTVRVQQRFGLSTMGRMHAVWSLSLAAAAALGAVAAAGRVPIAVHVGLVAAGAFALHLSILRGRGRCVGEGDAPREPDPDAPVAGRGRLGRLWPVLLVLGAAAFAASYIESPGQEWTGLLLSRGFEAGRGLAASAPMVFSVGLVASRLLLDAGKSRFGGAAMAAVSAVAITAAMLAGLVVALAHGSAYWALAAVAVGGVGAGPVFPLLFGAADHLSTCHGIAPATTATTVSALSRTGAISAPVVVGFLTDGFGMSMVFAVMAAGGAVLLAALPRAAR
jgi:hypothetical protein